jgi:RHS repeat-associated protein
MLKNKPALYFVVKVAHPPCGTSPSYGDLTSQTDPNGNTVCYQYDGIHRLKTVANSRESVSNPCKRLLYDNTANGILGAPPSGVSPLNIGGRLMEVETDDCTWPVTLAHQITDEWFDYSVKGELTDVWESTLHSSGYYHTVTSYFPNGTLNTLGGIPGQSAWTYGPEGEGRLNSAVQGTTNDVSTVTYNAASQPLTLGYANGDSDTYSYDSTGRMQTYTFTVGSTPTSMAGTLHWNANGSLQQLAITDGFNSGGTQTCNYNSAGTPGYDDLGRLINDNCGTLWSQTFSYDQYDNITKSGSITWAPGYNAVNNHYNLGGTSYDSKGNLLKDTFFTYSWNLYDHLASVIAGSTAANCGSTGTCLTYDGLDRVVEENVKGVYSQILYSPLGKTALMSGQTLSNAYVPLPGGSTLAQNSSQKVFWHKDWLGTVRFGSTIGRQPKLDRAFAPYGEMYDTVIGGTINPDFTGDTQNVISGLFDTPARELHPTQGRWISPDPARAGWNAYAYTENKPLTGTDPTGLDGTWGDPGTVCPGNWDGPECFSHFMPLALTEGIQMQNPSFAQFGILPGEQSLNLPMPSLPPDVAAAIGAAITGNWRGLLDSAVGAASRDLWGLVNKPGNCNPICDIGTGDWTDEDKLNIFKQVGKTAGQLNNPCSIGLFYGSSAVMGATSAAGASIATEGEVFPAMNAAWEDSSYWVSQVNRIFNKLPRPLQNKAIGAVGGVVAAAAISGLQHLRSTCNTLAKMNW